MNIHTLASWHSFIFNFSGRTGQDSNTSDKGRILGDGSMIIWCTGWQHNSCLLAHVGICFPHSTQHGNSWNESWPTLLSSISSSMVLSLSSLYYPHCQCHHFQMPHCHLFQDSGTCCLFFHFEWSSIHYQRQDQIPFNCSTSSSLAESELLPLGSIDGGTPVFGCKYFGNENMLWSSTNFSFMIHFQEASLWAHRQAFEAWWLLQRTWWDW